MQKIDKISLESRFIKNLLKNSYLPLFPLVPNTGLLYKGVIYTIGDKLFKCIKTGYIDNELKNDLKVNHGIYCNIDIYVGANGANIEGAKLELITSYIPYDFNTNITNNFISTQTGYDTDTHRQLGDYLRYYKMMEGIDLMPLYNCNCEKKTNQLDILKDNDSYKIIDTIQDTSTIYLIPAKLNSDYTLFFNNYSNTFIFFTFINDIGRIEYKNKDSENIKLDEIILKNIKNISECNYSNPIKINTILEMDDKKIFDISDIYKYEKNFYIGIKVENDIQSPLYVLEGDYTNIPKNTVYSGEYNIDEDYSKINANCRPSLISSSSTYSIPYSNSLFSYLVNFTIDSNEEIKNNVKRVQEKLSLMNNKNIKSDIWNDYLRFLILLKAYNPILQTAKEQNYSDEIKGEFLFSGENNNDVLGYIDKKLENRFFKYRGD